MVFEHKVAIVTGGASGIGKAVARAYAETGARVVIADVNPETGAETAEQLNGSSGECLFLPTDIRKPEQVTSLMKKTVERFGKIDILINNAGVSRFKSLYELTVDDWDEVINTNLRGTFLCAREAARYMRDEQTGGSIINIASTRAFMSEEKSEAYAATKGGIFALTHALAVSLSKESIIVNAISPGWIETGDYEALRPVDHDQHPSNRVGKPEDIGRACLFLTDPANNFITGENIIMDGGMTRKMIYEH